VIHICVWLHKRINKIGNKEFPSVLKELTNVLPYIVQKGMPSATLAFDNFEMNLKLKKKLLLVVFNIFWFSNYLRYGFIQNRFDVYHVVLSIDGLDVTLLYITTIWSAKFAIK